MFQAKSFPPRILFVMFVLAVSVALSPLIASAQTVTGTLQGTVTDQNGGVVPGVDIVVRNMETGQERNLKTNSEGLFTAAFLPLGRYIVSASASGFTTLSQENIEVSLNQTRVINLSLKPSTITEAVVVTTETTPINTT